MSTIAARAWGRVKVFRPDFLTKKPHFSFISAHYIWIISATILSSVLIFASRQDGLPYIDALMFASGANTQAGLNPLDLNKLTTFQQTVIYFFTMLSSPITLHACVVYLRLYWFEKKFQGWVKDAKQRRMSFSKSRSKARSEASERGVNGRNITIVPRIGNIPRVANDGVLLSEIQPKTATAPSSDGSDSTTFAEEHVNNVLQDLDPDPGSSRPSEETATAGKPKDTEQAPTAQAAQTAITFAGTVKRSDGVDDDVTKFPAPRSHAEHIAILERQRNQDNEVLRIPGPRDAERGLGPTRLGDRDGDDDEHAIARANTRDSFLEPQAARSRTRGRQPTITIAEPGHPKYQTQSAEDSQAAGGTSEHMRFRKHRIFNQSTQDRENTGGDDDPSRLQRARSKTVETLRSALSRDKTDDMPYLSYTPTIGRNSNFLGLTMEQREELGGIEYRSLRTLAYVLAGYFWGFQILAFTFLLPYILHNKQYGSVVEEAGVSRTWWAFWTSNSAFMDLGFTLTPDSMNSFARSEFVLMIMWFFIIIGNTGFPVMLRFIIWSISHLIPRHSGLWDETRFLLDHPRRCFTLLFPSGATWWLFWILVVLNAVDLIFFIILDLHSEVIEMLPVHSRIVNGLFQAASTRTAGFSSVSLGDLHPAMLVLYMIMMYISIFPIAISIRRTNVYEEKSLGVYHDKNDDDEDNPDPNALSYVGSHLRRQLSFDLWYVFLGLFLLTIAEGNKIQRGDFNIFTALFEIVSAYGTVGMSIGVPGVNASLSSQFSVPGKLIIVAMQIRGRHRGLPYGLDRAVLLPSENQFHREAEEEHPVIIRTNTNMSTATTTGVQRVASSSTRARSRSRDRVNSNVLVQLLHPGPAVPQPRRRTMSNESQPPQRTMSNESQHPRPFPRTHTEPVFEVEGEEEESPQSLRVPGRRIRTLSTPVN
jgi:potassium uptake Trk family protein